MTNLVLKYEGEIISYHRAGSSLFVDSIYVSPAYAGWSYGDYTLENAPTTDVDPPSPPTKEQLLYYASECRIQKESAGIEIEGVEIATDRDSQNLIKGAVIAVMRDPSFTTRFKAKNQWLTVGSNEISLIGDSVLEHVSSCFALESDVADKIEAEIITTYQEVEEEFL
jgi:hypothetical protein